MKVATSEIREAVMEIKRSIEVSNKYGLHARASTRLAQVAKAFRSTIMLSRPEDEDEVDAKSILGILTLGVAKGQCLQIRVSGEDAEQAMDAVIALVEGKFDEE